MNNIKDDNKKKSVGYELFKRELFASFSIYYFPLMILMSGVVIKVDFLRKNIAIAGPLLAIVFPGIVSVIIAFLRVRFVHKVDYKPNLKNFFMFLSIVSLIFLIQAVSYSIFQELDLGSLITYLVILLLSIGLYVLSKGKTNYKTVAKILAVISPFFVLEWFVYSLVLRTIYSFITCVSWLLVFVGSLIVLVKKRGE